MPEIRIIDKHEVMPKEAGLEYSATDSERVFWSEPFPKAGRINRYLCHDCGAVRQESVIASKTSIKARENGNGQPQQPTPPASVNLMVRHLSGSLPAAILAPSLGTVDQRRYLPLNRFSILHVTVEMSAALIPSNSFVIGNRVAGLIGFDRWPSLKTPDAARLMVTVLQPNLRPHSRTCLVSQCRT